MPPRTNEPPLPQKRLEEEEKEISEIVTVPYIEAVVAESVVVIKKLLQLQPKENKDLIKQVAKLADKVQVPSAKASILWLVGEYCGIVSKIAPDVLRKAAKNFPNEVRRPPYGMTSIVMIHCDSCTKYKYSILTCRGKHIL